MQHNFTWQTPNWLRVLCFTLLVGLTSAGANAQTLTNYSFVQTSDTYKQAGLGAKLTTTGCYDDGAIGGAITIPWTFTYHGASYTSIYAQNNGFARLGVATTTSGQYGTVLASQTNVLSPLNNDLYGCTANGAEVSYAVVGSTPNRVLTVQWSNWGIYSAGANEFSFQIKLYESNNSVQFVYKNGTATGSTAALVGLNGATTSDFQTRTTTTNWGATTAGATNTASCTVNATVRPTDGLTFTWTSAATVAAMVFAQTTTTYVPIEGASAYTSLTTGATTTYDDTWMGLQTIPWTFTYHGSPYTTIGVSPNGVARFAGNATSSSNYSVMTSTPDVLSPLNGDLYSTAAQAVNGRDVCVAVVGTSPNRTYVIQWSRWGFYSGGLNEVSFQIRLSEANNAVSYVYGPAPGIASRTTYVGLSGASTADFQGRTTTTNWAATTASAAITNTCTISSTVRPVNGLKFTWSPPLFTPCSGTPAPGTTVASANAVCSGTNFTMSLSNAFVGVSNLAFQWQSDAGAGFANIAGATNATYTTNQTTATSYQCNVTCTVSGLSAISAAVAVTMNPFYNCYCASAATSAADEDISNVTFGTLNNTSGCTTLAPGPGSVVSMYSNYKSGVGAPAAPTVSQGDLVAFSLTMSTCGGVYGNSFDVYIDFNQNGSFTDAGELVWDGPNVSGNHTDAGTISIPMSALTGQTAMRVVNVEGGATSPCGAYTWGETEDYLINILQALPCAGTPNPGNTKGNGVMGTINVCPGNVNYTLQNFTSGTGVTYQWNNLNGPVTGATNNTYTQSMTAYDEIYCDVTCSGITASSGVSYVNINSFLYCYCQPIHTYGTSGCFYGVISNVQLNTLNSSPACLNAAPYYLQNAPIGNATTSLNPGNTYTVSVTSNAYNSVGVWIDYNQNGSFEATEYLTMTPNVNSAGGSWVATGVFTVPLTAIAGMTGMRINTEYYFYTMSATSACGPYTYGETEDYLISVIPLPGTPGTPIEVGVPNCAVGGTIQSVGIAPPGVTWYWQTIATGTSTALPVSTNLNILSNGTYYVRAQDNTNLTWSAASSSVTVTDFPAGPVDPATAASGGNPACGSVTLLSSPAVSGTTNYWQGTNAVGTSTSIVADNGISNYPYSATTNDNYYIRAQDNITYCWSNPVATAVTIYALPTAPILTATPGTICPGSTSNLTAIAPSAPAAGYSVASIPYAPTTAPASTNAGPSGDDNVSASIPLGFSFNYYGSTYTSFVISTNGFLSFDAAPGAGCCAGQSIPSTTTPNNLIATCWTDLNTTSGGTIDYYNLTSPNRMVVRFNGVAHYGGTPQVTSEIIIYESGIIDIHNTSINSQGTMTQGIEGPGGVAATAVPGRNAAGWSATNDAYRFSPIQAFGLMWTPSGSANGINAGDEILPNITVNPTSSINYTMTITDPAYGCQNASSIAVNVVPIAPAPITTGASTPCGSSTVTLSASGTGGTLRWYTAPVGGTLVASGTSTFTTPLINASTTYYVEEYNGACAGPRTAVDATYTPSIGVTASSNVPAVCAGGPAILTASSANTNYSYTWEPGTLTGATVTVNPLVNTTYTLTGVDGACVNVATVTVLSGANPNILSVTATPGTICAGSTSQLFAAVLGGAGTTAPTYCSVTNAGSSCITSVILNTLNSAPPACVSPYYNFNAPTGTNTTYLTPGATYTFSLVTLGASIASVWIDYNRNGVYEASEWSQVWTNAASGTINVTVPLGATPGATGMRVRSRLALNTNGATSACITMGSGSTEDYVVTIVGGGGFNYSWTGSGLSSSTAYNPTATPSATDSYTVTVADATTGCTSTGSVVLNVIQLAPAPSVTGGATACGVGPVVLSASGTGGTLNWYNAPTGGTLLYSGSTYTTTAISSTTTYYVDETVGACTGPRAAVVATYTPSPVVTASSNVAYVCVGGANNTAVLTASSSNASYSYTWEPGGLTGASVTVTPTGTTTYTLTAVDGPCSNVATVTVNGPSVPVISSTIASPAVFCGGGTSQLLVDAGQLAPTYCTPTVFYTGASGDYIESFTFNTISNLLSGDNPSDYSLYSQTTTVLPGSTYALTATPGAAWGQGVGVWIDFNRNGSFADAGEFVFSSASGTATVSGNITIPASASNGLSRIRVCAKYAATPASTDYCGHNGFGEYEDYNITIGNGSGGLTFAWTPAAGLSNASNYDPTATVNASTTYSVTVTGAYGCAATSSVTVTVNQPSSSNTSMTTCAPIVWNGNTYATAGTYSFTTTNAAGCDSVATLNLTIACSTVVNLTCLIQGYWDAGSSSMLPVLFNQGELSTATACDSIDVELHDITTYAMVQSVRTILNQNGTANCVFPATSGDYYIVVKHRSAIQTWSALPVTVGPTAVSYNFTSAANQAYGDNQVEVSTGVWALYSGDIITDENIDLLDLGTLELDISNFSYGYMPTDLNGDGNVDLLDSPVLEANISNFVFSYHP